MEHTVREDNKTVLSVLLDMPVHPKQTTLKSNALQVITLLGGNRFALNAHLDLFVQISHPHPFHVQMDHTVWV